MAWQNEMSIILRHLVNDLDSSSYTFSDDRIEETILVASQLVLHEMDFESTYSPRLYLQILQSLQIKMMHLLVLFV